MAKGWDCPRCSTLNDEAAINCSSCRLIRGGVVPAGSGTTSPWMPVAADGVAVEAPPSADPSGATSAPTSLWRRIPTGWLVTAVIVVVGSVAGLYFNANRSSTGEITKGGDLTANELRVGDCFDLKDPAADEVDQVTARPCTDEHEYETFFVGSLPEGKYPAEDAFASFVEDKCDPAFETFIGKVYAESELDYLWFYPLSDGWDEGDRSVQCAVYHPRIHRLTESLKGSTQ